MYQDVSRAFKQAFQSISDHQEGKEFEKSLISSQLDGEFLEYADREFIKDILYPSKSKKSIKVSDAFGIFIGFEVDDADGKTMSEDDYEAWIVEKVEKTIEKRIKTIESYISDEWDWSDNGGHKFHKKSLIGKNFYVYLMPFTNLQETRKIITKGVTE